MKKLLIIFLLVVIRSLAEAQDYGFIGPVEDTTDYTIPFTDSTSQTDTLSVPVNDVQQEETPSIANLRVSILYNAEQEAAQLLPAINLNLDKESKFSKKQKFFIIAEFGAAITAQVISGYLRQRREVVLHDYDKYLLVHPNTNQQWTNPKISFRNKYVDWPKDTRPKFFGSKTFLVGFTDQLHLDGLISNTLNALTVGIFFDLGQKLKFKNILRNTAIATVTTLASNGLGRFLAEKRYKTDK